MRLKIIAIGLLFLLVLKDMNGQEAEEDDQGDNEEEAEEEEDEADNAEEEGDNDDDGGDDEIVFEGGGNATAVNETVEFVEVDYSIVGDEDAEEEVLSKANLTSVAHKLITLLFDTTGYNSYVRPVKKITDVTEVEMTIEIKNLLDVNGVESTIKVVTEMTYVWQDQLLQWNPSDFYGVDSIVVPTSKVWRPDVACIQTIEVKTPVPSENDLCRVFSDGKVNIQYLEVHELSCPMASKNFPYDKQLCLMEYGSYAYYINELIMSNVSHAVLSPEADHPEWNLKSFKVVQGEEEGVSRAVFRLLLVRKPNFYVVTLMLPSSLVTFLSILGVFTPGDISLERSEKINLAMITLLALSVLLTVMSDILPKTDTTYPLIGRFFFWQIGTIMVHVVVAVIIMFLNTMPEFAILLPKFFQRINFCRRPGPEKKENEDKASTLIGARADYRGSQEEEVLAEVLSDVKTMVEEWHGNKQAGDEEQANRDEWEIFCFMLDWIFLVIFLVLQLILTVVYCKF